MNRSMNNGNGPSPTWKDPQMIMLRDAQPHWWRLV